MPSSTPFQKLTLPFPHEEGKPLAHFSTFKIGGPARFFSEVRTKEELKLQLSFCKEKGLPFFLLGKGSNTLFDDRGFNGLVILNRLDYLSLSEPIFCASSGYSFARLGLKSASLGWSGLEFAAGIPATVGGAIFMNAGAGRQETKDTLVEVLYIDEEGKERRFSKEECQFSYRTSVFQKKKGAIIEGRFSLTPSHDAKLKQKQAVDYRLKTQPYKEPSIGCIFRNPKDAAAAQLIDKCGLKGMMTGGVQVSQKHANFIVNPQEMGKAQDVLDLIKKIKEKVFQDTGIELEEEVRFIPYE